MEEITILDEHIVCRRCGERKHCESFVRNRGCKNGFEGKCKSCLSAYGQEYYAKNRTAVKDRGRRYRGDNLESVRAKARERYASNEDGRSAYLAKNKARISARGKEYRKNNKESLNNKVRTYRENNRDKIAIQRGEYRESNRETLIAEGRAYYKSNREKCSARSVVYTKKRLGRDLNYKLRYILRGRMSAAIAGDQKAGSAIRDLGCTVEEFKAYIAAQFEPGMAWGNRGNKEGQWSIDHIMPLAAFDLTDRQHFLLAAHYLNQRPMWHVNNLRKNDTLPDGTRARHCRGR